MGSSHEGQDATDGDDSSAERTAQSLDNINAADAVARINSTLASEMTDSGTRGPDDARAQRRMMFKSITMLLLTVPGYPKDKADEAAY